MMVTGCVLGFNLIEFQMFLQEKKKSRLDCKLIDQMQLKIHYLDVFIWANVSAFQPAIKFDKYVKCFEVNVILR